MHSRKGVHSVLWKAAWDLLHDVSIAVLVCVFVVTFVAQPFRVQGTSMLPLLEDSERILVNKFIYHFRPPAPGEIIVLHPPIDASRNYIKRVVAVSGQNVRIQDGRVYVNERPLPEPYLRVTTNGDYGPQVVPP
ncbi:MAG TPA: signal peptidase I, partial [Vicinamibacteria bacterium]|nr:signal peptidase I [Vicinamibacteria bacterium]